MTSYIFSPKKITISISQKWLMTVYHMENFFPNKPYGPTPSGRVMNFLTDATTLRWRWKTSWNVRRPWQRKSRNPPVWNGETVANDTLVFHQTVVFWRQKGMKLYYPVFFLGGRIVISCKMQGIIILPSYIMLYRDCNMPVLRIPINESV